MESFLQFAAYGYLVQMLTQLPKAVAYKLGVASKEAIQSMAFSIALALAYWGGVDAAAMLGVVVDKSPLLRELVSGALLAGASMGTHDLIDLVNKKR